MIAAACAPARAGVTLAALVLVAGCTTVSRAPPSPLDRTGVDACTFAAHLQCIALTAEETVADGLHAEWTRHWFRMSYIGRACVRRYGRTAGVVIESLFALPHYGAMAIGNGAATLVSPFVRAPQRRADPGAVPALTEREPSPRSARPGSRP